MAALICDYISKLCENCCQCLTVPCRACGDCCSKVVCSPFFPYLAVTAALNIPPAIWGLQGLQCGDDASWLLVNGALCVAHIVASFYIVNKMQKEGEEWDDQLTEAEVIGDVEGNTSTKATGTNYQKMESNQSPPPFKAELFNMATKAFVQASPARHVMRDRGETTQSPVSNAPKEGHPNTMQRMSQVLCYDPGVAIYILLAAGWLFWQTVGVSQVFGKNDDSDEAGACTTQQWIFMSLGCGIMFASLVCVAFACSLLCLR